MSIDARLDELGIVLPEVPDPAGNYVHVARTGNLLFLAGKGPRGSTGKVGTNITETRAQEDARDTGLTLIAVMRQELGSLDRVSRIVKVFGMVNAAPTFGNHPAVIDGCSDLFVEVFGDAGRHARSAVGMSSLPNEITVEIECIVEIID